MDIKYNPVYKLQKLVEMVEFSGILTVVFSMVDFRKNKYVLIVDTAWAGSEILAYRYMWSEQKLEIVAGIEVIEEKTLKL